MRQRHVTEAEVEWVLANPRVSRQGRKGATVMIGRPAGRRIKVVVNLILTPPFIITIGD